jgi:low temperature requirement protein LtrA
MSADADSIRVTTLELFFDLVFVFTITQLTAILLADPNPRGLLSAILMLGVTWWMYGGYAWLTNAVPPNTTTRRLLLMAGMAGFLVMALAIPGTFDGNDGLAFGLGYLLVTAVHTALFTKTTAESAVRAILRLAPFNFVSAILVLLAGILGGTAEFVLWSAAFGLQVIAPYLSGQEGFVIQAAHFVERHGLVVIIAFGESIVAIGIGASQLRVDAALVFVAVLGLALTGCLWWLYFGGDDDEEAERALGNTPHERRPNVALVAYGYAHLALLFGIVLLSAGVKKAIGHAFEHLAPAAAWYLAGGVALFLLGDALFRAVLGIGRNGYRVAAALVALATVPLGQSGVAVAQLGALVVVLFVAIVAERLRARSDQLITR